MDWVNIGINVLSGGTISVLGYFILIVKYKEKVDALEKMNLTQTLKDVAVLTEFKTQAQKFIDDVKEPS